MERPPDSRQSTTTTIITTALEFYRKGESYETESVTHVWWVSVSEDKKKIAEQVRQLHYYFTRYYFTYH